MILSPAILVIEDRKRSAAHIQHSLEKLGYHNIHISTGSESKPENDSVHPDIVLMDVLLKEKNPAVRKIIHDSENREIPVVYVSTTGSGRKNGLKSGGMSDAVDTHNRRALKDAIENAVHLIETEQKLKESELRYQSILENAVIGIIVMDERGIVRDANEAVCHLTGIDRDKLTGRHCAVLARKFLKGKNLNKVLKVIQDLLLGKPIEPYPLKFNDRIIEIHSPQHAGSHGFTVIFHDITDKKQAEDRLTETATKYKKLFEIAHEGMIYINTKGQILDINNHALSILRVPRAKIIYKNYEELPFLNENTRKEIQKHFKQAMQKDRMTMNITIGDKENTGKYLECMTTRVKKKNRIEGILLTAHDITDHVRHENQIRTSLKEKEILLQEIHHRVKNNLQIISSLLHLQSFQINDEKMMESVKQSQNRIRTMAILHEQLYRADDLTRLDFEHYTRSLVRHLLNQYAFIQNRIEIRIKIKKCMIGLENAVYCGLIINELISNVFKHAFPENREGVVQVILNPLKGENGYFELKVKDNGIGIPENVDVKNTASLGLRLVRLLTEDQMQGRFEFRRTPETLFRIIFKERSSVNA
ncbi:PAS domain S-box protein [bacterium]|nr:PAS domain S-box protein [bacterium]